MLGLWARSDVALGIPSHYLHGWQPWAVGCFGLFEQHAAGPTSCRSVDEALRR